MSDREQTRREEAAADLIAQDLQEKGYGLPGHREQTRRDAVLGEVSDWACDEWLSSREPSWDDFPKTNAALVELEQAERVIASFPHGPKHCAKCAEFYEAAKDLYERVEMDESVGVCLSDRVPSLRLGAALAHWEQEQA
jgi:hypothetical protein